ncbi:hypothetical protein ACWV95_32205 [Streptomyces albus]
MSTEPARVDAMLASLGRALRAEKRTFDEAAALRRLARDAGYTTPLADLPTAAGQQLRVVVGWGSTSPAPPSRWSDSPRRSDGGSRPAGRRTTGCSWCA